MDDVESLVKTTIDEIERLIGTKTVVGEPIVIDGNTLIPLLSVGFGFGAGGSLGVTMAKQKGEANGSFTGGGAGVKPIAMVVVNKEGVRVEPIMSGMSGAIEKITETAPKVVEKFWDKKEKKEEKKEK